jgi:hypothetical protein
MVVTLEQFIDALRNELQQYGEMLALLEAQGGALNRHGTHSVAASVSSLTAHGATIECARRTRETLQRKVAWSLGVAEEQTVQQLVRLVPEEYRPLLEALIQEIQELLRRVRECAGQNREHLRHSLELMEQFIARLSPPVGSALLGEKSTSNCPAEPPPNLADAV